MISIKQNNHPEQLRDWPVEAAATFRQERCQLQRYLRVTADDMACNECVICQDDVFYMPLEGRSRRI